MISRRYIGCYINPEILKNDRCLVQLAETMDLFELSSSTREILQCLWVCPSVRTRDSMSAYVVMVQVRDGLAPKPETSITSYHMLMENQRALKTLEECRHVKP